jgi:hypothetical protein
MIVAFEPPVARAVLEKFWYMPRVNRLFDSGALQLYDVGELWRDP